MLRQYISWVQEFQPGMTEEAEGILMRYYQLQRQSSSRDAARTTVRMFESLIRTAQANLLHPQEFSPILRPVHIVAQYLCASFLLEWCAHSLRVM